MLWNSIHSSPLSLVSRFGSARIKRLVIKSPKKYVRQGKERRRTQNRNYKFMRLSLRSEASLFFAKQKFIHKLCRRLRRSGIMNGRNETRGGICMCVDLIIFLFLSMEHLLLWLSAKLFVLWFRFVFLRFTSETGGAREREGGQWMKSESVRLYYWNANIWTHRPMTINKILNF
jgi:hypothetical protein